MEQTQTVQPYDVSSSKALALPLAERTGRELEAAPRALNVHQKERIASVALGGVALWLAARAHSHASPLLAALGSALVYRGATGHCHVYEAFGFSTREGA